MRSNWKNVSWVGLLMVALLALVLAPAASAQWRIQGDLGYYNPDGNVADDDVSLGFRVGYELNPKFGMELTYETFDAKLEEFSTQEQGNNYDLDLRTIDFSFIWYPTGGGYYLLGGPGWTEIDLEVYVPGNDNNFKADDSLVSWHVGTGYFWKFDSGFYMRPEVKFRWVDQNLEDSSDGNQHTTFVYDSVDFGAYLGFGYTF